MKKRNSKAARSNVKEGLNIRSFFYVLAFSLFLLFFIGCSKSGAPSCSDDSVKGLVLDISAGELRNQLLSQNMMMSSIRVPGSYDDIKKIASEPNAPPEVVELISKVDEQITQLNINLINVRMNGKNNEIKKCDCGGDLSFANGKTHSITYTAQYTEDGKVYVEVAGLK